MGVGSNNIRIAFWTTSDAQQSDIIAYCHEILGDLASLCDVEVFVDKPEAFHSQGLQASVYQAEFFSQRHVQLPFDMHIYQLGSSPVAFETVYRQFLRYTGIVVLHDLDLLPLYEELFFNRGYQAALLNEVEYNYGLDTRDQVQEAIINGTPLSALDPKPELNRRVVERALTVVVHTQAMYDVLVQRYPHKQIVYIPLNEQHTIGHQAQIQPLLQAYYDVITKLLFSSQSTPWAKREAHRRRATGVNFLADLKVSAGLGAAAMSLLDATLESEVAVAFTEVQHNFWRRTAAMSPRYQSLPQGNIYPINILCTNIHELHQVTPDELTRMKGGKYTIASWFWELPEIPDAYLPEFERIDEIWVASRYTQNAMLSVAKTPVQVIPCAVEVKTSPRVDRRVFGIPEERFVFLFSFSAVSCSARKNPWGVIEAFERAFGRPDDRGPLLVIKSHHVDLLPEFQLALREALERVGGLLIEGDYTRQQTNDLLACADAYVSLHRAEGFGLGMAESMYLGKPVIGTAYSANTDFMTADNSYLVDYHLRSVTPYDHRYQTECLAVYEPGQIWAEPDVEQAAFWMQYIYEHQNEARVRGRKAAVDIRRYCSPAAVGRMVEERLIEIEAQNPTRVSMSHIREQAYAKQAQHHERYKYWLNRYEEVEALPSAAKPLGRVIAPLLDRSKPLRFLAHTFKRLRWMGYTTANQHEFNRASVEVIDALTDALVSSDASLPALQATITGLQNKLTKLEQVQADPAKELERMAAEIDHLRHSGEDHAPSVSYYLDTSASK